MKRMLAEWENPRKILVSLPAGHTDWNYIFDEAIEQFRLLIGKFLEGGETLIVLSDDHSCEKMGPLRNHPAVELIRDVNYNDTWTRDYGPITVVEKGTVSELDFGFNGWGLKFAADKDNLVNLHLKERGYLDKKRYRNNRDFTLEGGSVESDGKGLILTTSKCLCSPNRNGGKSKSEIEEILRVRLGAEKVLWLDHGFLAGDDTDSHIDTLARIAPNDSIIYVAPPADNNDIHYEEFIKMQEELNGFKSLDGHPFNLIPLPFPDAIYDDEGMRLPATYANYLVTGRNVFVPTYAQPDKDNEACRQIRKAFPDHKVIPVECLTLIKQHGSLHCSTMQLY